MHLSEYLSHSQADHVALFTKIAQIDPHIKEAFQSRVFGTIYKEDRIAKSISNVIEETEERISKLSALCLLDEDEILFIAEFFMELQENDIITSEVWKTLFNKILSTAEATCGDIGAYKARKSRLQIEKLPESTNAYNREEEIVMTFNFSTKVVQMSEEQFNDLNSAYEQVLMLALFGTEETSSAYYHEYLHSLQGSLNLPSIIHQWAGLELLRNFSHIIIFLLIYGLGDLGMSSAVLLYTMSSASNMGHDLYHENLYEKHIENLRIKQLVSETHAYYGEFRYHADAKTSKENMMSLFQEKNLYNLLQSSEHFQQFDNCLQIITELYALGGTDEEIGNAVENVTWDGDNKRFPSLEELKNQLQRTKGISDTELFQRCRIEELHGELYKKQLQVSAQAILLTQYLLCLAMISDLQIREKE